MSMPTSAFSRPGTTPSLASSLSLIILAFSALVRPPALSFKRHIIRCLIILVHRLFGFVAPFEAVFRAREREQPHAMIRGIPSGRAADDDVIAVLQSVSVNAGLCEARGAGPFDR